MKKFEFKAVMLRVDRLWTGKAHSDYLEILNKEGADGWDFAGFAPVILNKKGFQELLFKREVIEF